jgi:hypothetical protein
MIFLEAQGWAENREDKLFHFCHFPLGCCELASTLRLHYVLYRIRNINRSKVIQSRTALSDKICYAYCWEAKSHFEIVLNMQDKNILVMPIMILF